MEPKTWQRNCSKTRYHVCSSCGDSLNATKGYISSKCAIHCRII